MAAAGVAQQQLVSLVHLLVVEVASSRLAGCGACHKRKRRTCWRTPSLKRARSWHFTRHTPSFHAGSAAFKRTAVAAAERQKEEREACECMGRVVGKGEGMSFSLGGAAHGEGTTDNCSCSTFVTAAASLLAVPTTRV